MVVVDDIDSWVAQIECLWLVYFQHYYLMLAHCHLRIVLNKTGHQLEKY
jgi:hypothetical protein